MSYFWKSERETPFTLAVINNDTAAIHKMKHDEYRLKEKNFLGFTGIELAKYLDKRECLDILEKHMEQKFFVVPKGSVQTAIFSENEFEHFFGVRYLRFLKFENYRLFKKIIKNCSSIFMKKAEGIEKASPELLDKFEGMQELFTLRADLYYDKLYSGYAPHLIIKWINDRIGYGVFAGQDFKEGEYIASYTGVVRRLAFWRLVNDYSIFYPNPGFTKYAVDAGAEGNIMRFANHSSKPNIIPQAACDRGLLHSLFIAGRDIATGEQLCWDYGDAFWSSREPPQEI